MLSYRIDPSVGFVEILGLQGPDPREFVQLFEAIFADPAYRPGMGFYRDRRGMESMTSAMLRSNMDNLASMPGLIATRWAYVVTDPSNYGMARMASMIGDGVSLELQIFDAPEPAIAWLAERTELSRRPAGRNP